MLCLFIFRLNSLEILSPISWKLGKFQYCSLHISKIGPKYERNYSAVVKIYTLQTYELSRIPRYYDALPSVIIQLGISCRMSLRFTVLTYILQLPTQFSFIKHIVTHQSQNPGLNMRNEFSIESPRSHLAGI